MEDKMKFKIYLELRKDLPEDIKNLLIITCYTGDRWIPFYKEEEYKAIMAHCDICDLVPPHVFFTLDRFDHIFGFGAKRDRMGGMYFSEWDTIYHPRLIKTSIRGYGLSLEAEIEGNGLDELIIFLDWIKPYLAGHSTHKYIGWYKPGAKRLKHPINIYLNLCKTGKIWKVND